MKFHSLTDLVAAHDIDDGLEYLKHSSTHANNFLVQGVRDMISNGLSTGSAIANFPASEDWSNVEKVRIRNNSLCILCPEYMRAEYETGLTSFSRTPGVLYPGDEGEFEFSYRPVNNRSPVYSMTFLVISVDTNFTGLTDLPHINEIPVLRVRLISDRGGKLRIHDVDINRQVLTPKYAAGTDHNGADNTMSYFTYRGTEGSREPSFGMAWFNVRAATVNLRNATGTTSLVFTPSAKRSSAPVTQLVHSGTQISGFSAVRNFLRVCSYNYRTEKLKQTRSFAAYSTLVGMFASAKDIYSSIATRTDSRSYLTVNLRNLTGKNMFVLRTKHSNSMRMDNGIIMDGDTGAIPLSFTSFRPQQPEMFIRIPLGNDESIDLIVRFRDLGENRTIKVDRITLSGPGIVQADATDSNSVNGVSNFVFNFVSPNGQHRIFIQPTVVASHVNPTIDIAFVMVANRPEFNPALDIGAPDFPRQRIE